MAHVVNLISKHKYENETLRWREIDSNPSDKLRGNIVARSAASLLIGFDIIRCITVEQGKQRQTITHIHTSSFTGFFEKIFFVLLAKWVGSPVLLHIHGGAFNQFFSDSSGVFKSAIRRSLLLPDRLIVLSAWWARFFRDQVDPKLEDRMAVLHNSVEMPTLTLDDVVRARAEETTLRVVFLGSIGDRKGCGELLQAASRLSNQPGIQFYLLGGGEHEGDLERYKERSREMGLSNVHFLGYVSGKRKADQLKEADLFVLPSRADNFPISLLEAMSYGLPVVVSSVGAMGEVVTEENGIVISPRDTDALVDAIQFMYQHPKRREEIGHNNAHCAAEQYSASKYLKTLESIYSDLTEAT
jgi:glycosyltransferase involved in cell wall biosynthesis